MATTTPNYGWRLPTVDDFITVAADVAATVEDIDTELKRVDDLASNPALISGKLWRTGAFTALPAAAADIDFEASRATGGMTVSANHQGLVIPVDGFYDVRCHGFSSGGNNANVLFNVYRIRSAVANKVVIRIQYYKLSNAGEDHCIPGADVIAFKANDEIRVLGSSSGGAVSTWGVDEADGIRLVVEYKRPLNGVTPL